MDATVCGILKISDLEKGVNREVTKLELVTILCSSKVIKYH